MKSKVHIRVWSIRLALAIAVSISAGVAAADPARSDFSIADEERECNEYVPERYSTSPTPSGEGVAVDTLVLTDGVSRRDAVDVLAYTATLYESLDIRVVPKFRRVSFKGAPHDGQPAGDIRLLFHEAMAAVGGRVPRGIDVVVLLTNKALFTWQDSDGDGEPDYSERTYGPAGAAMCIGGIRWPETSFAISNGAISDTWSVREAAVVFAHEIGHLLGAHHHYANCLQGTATGPQDGQARACTIMFNATYELGPVHTMADVWSQLEASVITAHASEYAAP